jgi:Mrp family chromosome partitioning ATPase
MSDPDGTERIYAGRRPVTDPAAIGYLLPAEVGNRIFREEIVPRLLASPEPQARPTVVFLVGQHGAGKSRTAAMVAEALGRLGGFADLDSDLYKPYHPRYDELMSSGWAE